MEQVKLAKWIKLVLAGAGLCGLFVYAAILPAFGLSLVAQYPEFGYCYRPWLIFLCLTGVPCYVVLALGWRIETRTSQGSSSAPNTSRSDGMISCRKAPGSIRRIYSPFIQVSLS